jgi:hypothetical protein
LQSFCHVIPRVSTAKPLSKDHIGKGKLAAMSGTKNMPLLYKFLAEDVERAIDYIVGVHYGRYPTSVSPISVLTADHPFQTIGLNIYSGDRSRRVELKRFTEPIRIHRTG